MLFLDDGRIEMDSNAVERTIRSIALNRKNALFAGHDAGAVNWGVIASLIETCKLNDVDPHTYLADVMRGSVEFLGKHGDPFEEEPENDIQKKIERLSNPEPQGQLTLF